jgi:hypothetical protein
MRSVKTVREITWQCDVCGSITGRMEAGGPDDPYDSDDQLEAHEAANPANKSLPVGLCCGITLYCCPGCAAAVGAVAQVARPLQEVPY